MVAVTLKKKPSDKGRTNTHAAHLPEAQLHMEWDGTPILLTVYPFAAERHHRRGPLAGRSQMRARAEAVAALLEAAAPT